MVLPKSLLDAQAEGTELIVRSPYTYLGDEMGIGKSAQTIKAACQLYEKGIIDTVVVVAPAAVRASWADPDFGEIQKHATVPVTCQVHLTDALFLRPEALAWVVCSYELFISEVKTDTLRRELMGRKVMLVADEAIRLANHRASSVERLTEFRYDVNPARVVVLNGTPLNNNGLLSLYSQYYFLHKKILRCDNYYHFRARHFLTHSQYKDKVLQVYDQDIIERQIAPYTLRRTKKEVLDLPDKEYSVLTTPMSLKAWKHYKELKDEMLTMLDDESMVMTQHPTVLLMRLLQLTSGRLCGISDGESLTYQEMGSVKQQLLFHSLTTNGLVKRAIVWCRFRHEIEDVKALAVDHGLPCYQIYGGQADAKRQAAIKEFTTGSPEDEGLLVAQVKAGGYGLNLVTCHQAYYLSNDFSLVARLQSEDRNHRIGQVETCRYVDLLATGPKGERTADHLVLKSLRANQDMATWTLDRWRKTLKEEL
jgi:SNF2 family DNA or RNA helicase